MEDDFELHNLTLTEAVDMAENRLLSRLLAANIHAITFQDPFFQDICIPTSRLHHLIPLPRDTSVTTRLRLATSLPGHNLRTKRYCLLRNFGLYTITNENSDS